ncbi:MAG: L-serine ammonia-lyase, iron-sulfur-dependent, subunit alpha [Clostridiales bacterium]|nr:L-serine ammonia-lyase, iron-sulfur-dependent, subunit alpha [Clostridiales bacterium]
MDKANTENKAWFSAYADILREELLLAMGCTEPISIAYAASIATHALGCRPAAVNVGLSGSIIKNVKSVLVPATGGLHGVNAAVAAGVIADSPQLGLNVLSALGESKHSEIKEYMNAADIKVHDLDSEDEFEIDLSASRDGHVARVHIVGEHTNVVAIESDGKDVTDEYIKAHTCTVKHCDHKVLNMKNIVEFAKSVNLDELRVLLKRQIEVNLAIADEGLKGDYGASIGKLLYNDGNCNVRNKARAYAAAGSDARMSGCEMPVCIVSGSGNQGMTTSLPVIVYAKELGVDEDVLLRALIVANLTTLYQKTEIGCLSAYCGAISAGCGSGCGISYLHNGGDYDEIAQTLVNSVVILSGTICDGAKASCAAKIAMAVEAGIMGFEMARSHKNFNAGDGVAGDSVNDTVCNIGRIAGEGMAQTNKTIIQIMTDTENK